jgi:hypothetical protein
MGINPIVAKEVVPRVYACNEISISSAADALIKTVRLIKEGNLSFDEIMRDNIKDSALEERIRGFQIYIESPIDPESSDWDGCKTSATHFTIISHLAVKDGDIIKKLEKCLIGIIILMVDYKSSLEKVLSEVVVGCFSTGWRMVVEELINGNLRYEILNGGHYYV